jgi:hypothetical protein
MTMTTISKDALCGVALDAAARGWHVFPLRHNDKRPAFPDHSADRCTGTDYRCRAAGAHVGWEPRATTDPDRIRRAWRSYSYNIGIACGPSGLVVIDPDKPKPGEDTRPEAWRIEGVNDGVDVLCLLAEQAGASVEWDTYTVTSGRGGTHLYYQHPTGEPLLRNTAGQLGWLVDTRAHGGYVVAGGSVAHGRPYSVARDTDVAPLSGWLAEMLRPAPLPVQAPVLVSLPTGVSAYVRAAVARECASITGAASHHNDALYLASVALGQLVAGGSLESGEATRALEHAGISVGLKLHAVRATIASGFRAGGRRPRTVAA